MAVGRAMVRDRALVHGAGWMLRVGSTDFVRVSASESLSLYSSGLDIPGADARVPLTYRNCATSLRAGTQALELDMSALKYIWPRFRR